MGDDASSAKSALFSPRRSRPVERSKNRSWRTNAAARHVGSVALVIYPPELSAHTESFRTSKRSAASGEASPICTQWRVFTQTERRPSVAKKLGDDATSAKSAPFSPRRSRPVERREKPIMANQCGRAPRWQCRLGCLSAGVECTYGELPIFGTQRRLRRGLSDLY